MPLTFAQYETLFNDATVKPRLKALAARRLRNWFKNQPVGTPNGEYVSRLAQLQSDAFLDAIRYDTLGELDDAGTATPTANDIAAAAVAAIQRAFGDPTL